MRRTSFLITIIIGSWIAADAHQTPRTGQQPAEASIHVSSVIAPLAHEPAAFPLEIPGTIYPQIGESGRNSNPLTADVQNLQTAALAALDARDHPVTIEAIVTAAAVGRVRALGGSLSEAEMDALLEVAGWPVEWRAEAKQIAWCESKWSPYAVGDSGSSLGLFQLWTGWFAPAGYSPAQAFDPVVNSRAALYARQLRGRWGGGGGWSCADRLGIE